MPGGMAGLTLGMVINGERLVKELHKEGVGQGEKNRLDSRVTCLDS